MEKGPAMLHDLFKRQMFLVVSQSSGYYDKQTYNSLIPELSAIDGHSIAFTQKTFLINFLYRIVHIRTLYKIVNTKVK